jgi:hypothetical protein
MDALRGDSNVNKIGLWTKTGKSLARLAESQIELETQLENWIAEDPSLIRDGLTVVGSIRRLLPRRRADRGSFPGTARLALARQP